MLHVTELRITPVKFSRVAKVNQRSWLAKYTYFYVEVVMTSHSAGQEGQRRLAYQ